MNAFCFMIFGVSNCQSKTTGMKESFDASDFVIQFKAIFLIEELGAAWYNFLKTEYNSENWEFILQLSELEKLQKKKNHTKILKQLEFIISQFIAPESPKEILVGRTHKKKILEETQKINKKHWNLSMSPLEIFEPLKISVLLEYKNDSFKRFVRTEECLNVVEKHQNNQQVLLPQLALLYSYTDDDFKHQPITKKDEEFLEHFNEV
jgi:hypothetical protein